MTRRRPAARPDGGTSEGAFFRHAPDPVVRYRWRDDPTVVAVNPAFQSAFDVDDESLAGRPLASVLRSTAIDASGVEAEPDGLLQTVRSRQRGTMTLRLERSQHARQYRATHVPLDAGEDGGYLVFTDVTELGARIRELEAKVEQLEEATNVIAHDIRNPLEVAEINLEVGRETDDDELLGKVAAAHEQIERLIEDVLTLAAEGQVIDERAAVELDEVLTAAWSNVDTADAELVIDDSRVIEADADRLRQLLENLFRNAVEHGGDAVTVRAGPLDAGFYVEDDGPGIPEDVRSQVFEQGFSGETSGSGLGLAIVDRIAEAHGWDVGVRTGRDGGARFEVTEAVEAAG